MPKLELLNLKLRYPAAGQTAADSAAGDTTLAVDLLGESQESRLAIYPSQFTVFLGPSGCGKSSLLRMIAGLEKPTEGCVLIDGDVITGPGRDRGMVFQSYTTFPWLTVEENVLFGLKLRSGFPGKISREAKVANKEKARDIIETVGLADAMSKYPAQLSGGMEQRVGIARALVNNPSVLLMDEPFGALDPQIRVQMQHLLLDIEEKLGTTILFVTHDAREAVILGDVIYISTCVPCFLKNRFEHPFEKQKIRRVDALREHRHEFALFQTEVEDCLQSLIENPNQTRSITEGDQKTLARSSMGVFEELDRTMTGRSDGIKRRDR